MRGTDTLACLYRLQRNRLFAVCFAMLRDPDDAEDAVQETFARVAAQAEILRGEATGYLITVARNVCRDELRRRAVRNAAAMATSRSSLEQSSAEESVVVRRTLERALCHLSSDERAVFAFTASGLTVAETAQRMGISASLAAQRMFRARQRLRRIMPNPAYLAMADPRTLLTALARRMQNRGNESLLPLVARFHEAERVIAPLVLGAIVGGAAGAPMAVRPHTTGPVAMVTPPAARIAAAAQPALRRTLPLHAPVRSAPAPLPPPDVPPLDLTSFTASPSYQRDHTVYATGDGASSCSGACTVTLYRTGDGGRTWQGLATVPEGDRILLPPAYPADRTVFLAGAGGLLRSDDGGRTFTSTGHWACSSLDNALSTPLPVALPTPAPTPSPPKSCAFGVEAAAVDPDSPVGDTRIYMLTNPSQGDIPIYDSASGNVEAGPSTPGSVTMLFTAPHTHGVYAMDGGGDDGGGALYHCTDSCSRIGSVPSGRATYVLSQTFGADETFFYAVSWGRTPGIDTVTASGAQHYTAAPQGWSPVAVLPHSDYATSRVYDVIAMRDTSPHDLTLMRAVGDGPLETRQGVVLPDMLDFSSVVRMPDGHLFATLMAWASDRSAVLCSSDDGVRWARHCTAG